jgi:hypothetical protein
VSACLREQDVKVLVKCIKLRRERTNICWTILQFMSRERQYARKVCGICAEVCNVCDANAKSMQVTGVTIASGPRHAKEQQLMNAKDR